MHDTIDLQAYLRRIGWQGAVAPDMATLQAIATAHVAAIPFENINPLLGLPVSLELAALERKLVHEGRGGYCFEQNLLFEAVLRAVGFEVSGLIARVLWTRPEDAVTPQTHMLLRVELAGESCLVDVGFGGQNLVGVLRLQADYGFTGAALARHHCGVLRDRACRRRLHALLAGAQDRLKGRGEAATLLAELQEGLRGVRHLEGGAGRLPAIRDACELLSAPPPMADDPSPIRPTPRFSGEERAEKFAAPPPVTATVVPPLPPSEAPAPAAAGPAQD